MTDKKKKIEIESNISPKALFEKMGGSGEAGSGKKNIEREKKYWAEKNKKRLKKKIEAEKTGPLRPDIVYKPIKSISKAKGGRVGYSDGGQVRPDGGWTD